MQSSHRLTSLSETYSVLALQDGSGSGGGGSGCPNEEQRRGGSAALHQLSMVHEGSAEAEGLTGALRKSADSEDAGPSAELPNVGSLRATSSQSKDVWPEGAPGVPGDAPANAADGPAGAAGGAVSDWQGVGVDKSASGGRASIVKVDTKQAQHARSASLLQARCPPSGPRAHGGQHAVVQVCSAGTRCLTLQ